jgi:hypothetical protein
MCRMSDLVLDSRDLWLLLLSFLALWVLALAGFLAFFFLSLFLFPLCFFISPCLCPCLWLDLSFLLLRNCSNLSNLFNISLYFSFYVFRIACVCGYMCPCMCVHVCLRPCVYVDSCACMDVWMCICVYVYIPICEYVYFSLWMFIRPCVSGDTQIQCSHASRTRDVEAQLLTQFTRTSPLSFRPSYFLLLSSPLAFLPSPRGQRSKKKGFPPGTWSRKAEPQAKNGRARNSLFFFFFFPSLFFFECVFDVHKMIEGGFLATLHHRGGAR